MESLEQALRERDRARACAILAIVVACAIVAHAFVGHWREAKATEAQILGLQAALDGSQKATLANEHALVETQKALARATESGRSK